MMKAWPTDFRCGREPSAEAWCDIIRRPEAWTDMALDMGSAHLFSACCAVSSVDELGAVRPMVLLEPSPPESAVTWMELGCWDNRPFAGVTPAPQSPADSEGWRVGKAGG